MNKYDFLIVGGGPGGYTCALNLAKQGKTVALFEKNKIGGACLHVGCIPTKLLQSAASRFHALAKEGKAWGIEADNVRFNFPILVERIHKTVGILEKGIVSQLSTQKVEVIQGQAWVKDKNLVECNGMPYPGNNLVLATGSRPKTLSKFPVGVNIVTSDELLSQPRLPKTLLILGAGVIGLEFACLYAQLGIRVRLGDILPRILPTMDDELGQLLLNSIRRLGVEVELGSEIKPKDEEMVLIAVGRMPNSDLAGIPALGLKTRDGKIETNGYLETSQPAVYAIGDLTGNYPYAHTAYEHARILAGSLKPGGLSEEMNERKVPHVVFTSPEIAAVGYTEEEAKREFKNVTVRKNAFAANSKARILGEIQGWCKMVADTDTGRILGFQMAGPEATDLIGEACALVAQETTLDQLGKVVHPHPTLNEIFGGH